MAKKKLLGQILLETGVIDENQLEVALGYQKKWGGKLGRILVDNNWISEEALINAIQSQTGHEIIDLENIEIQNEIIDQVPVELAERHTLLPVGLESETGRTGEILVLAVADPTDLNAQDEVQFYTGKKVKVMLASESSITLAIKRLYHGRSLDEMSEGFFQADSSDIQFRGHDMEADDFMIVDGKLESTPGEPMDAEHEAAPLGIGSDWDNDAFGDPFADFESSAKAAESKPHSHGSFQVNDKPDQIEAAVQEIRNDQKTEEMPLEDDLPEVEVIEDLLWDAASTQNVPEPQQSHLENAESGELDAKEPSFDPSLQPGERQSVGGVDDPVLNESTEEFEKIPESSLNQGSTLEETSQPLADLSWLTQPSTKKDFDFFDSIPTNSSAFGVSGDLLGSESLLENELEGTPLLGVQRETEKEKSDQSTVQIAQDNAKPELKSSEEMGSSSAQTDIATEEVELPEKMQRIRMKAVSEDNRQLSEPQEEVSQSLVVELADEVQKLLEGLESDQVNGEPPTIVKSSHLIAAVIRLLLKRDVFSEAELLEELKQR